MPITDQTPEVTLFDGTGVEVGTAANPLAIRDPTTGTLANGAQTAVGAAAVQVLAANANRKVAFVQNVGNQNIRVGITGVTATTGLQLTPGSAVIFESPFVTTQAIFAIREGGASSTAFAMEIA